MKYNSVRFFLGAIRRKLVLYRNQAKWRKLNRHNETCPANIFPLEKVKVGRYTYGDLNIYSYRNPEESLIIGDFCSIASDVVFVLGGEHNYNRFTSFPLEEKFFGAICESRVKGPIIIEDDVWIGTRCTILSGVRIGKGAIIAAGSVVHNNIPSYAVYASGKIIKYRFESEIIKELENLDFSSIDKDTFKDIRELITQNIDINNVRQIKKAILETTGSSFMES